MRLLGAADVRRLARDAGVAPTKRLGQNFVIDANTVRRIVRLAGVEAGEAVLEVGPGLGSLTLGLLEAGARVVAIEIDPRLAARLPETVAGVDAEAATRLTVLAEDALTVHELPVPATRLVANLPYNVAVPVILTLLERIPTLASGLTMVQAEVGHRLAAEPGSRVYGAPSVKAAWYGSWRIAGSVSRHVFWPEPNVDSVLVSYRSHDEPLADEARRRRTFAVVDAAFAQRRKTLRQSLAPLLGAASSDRIAGAGVDPAARPERLGVGDFLRIAESWARRRSANADIPDRALH